MNDEHTRAPLNPNRHPATATALDEIGKGMFDLGREIRSSVCAAIVGLSREIDALAASAEINVVVPNVAGREEVARLVRENLERPRRRIVTDGEGGRFEAEGEIKRRTASHGAEDFEEAAREAGFEFPADDDPEDFGPVPVEFRARAFGAGKRYHEAVDLMNRGVSSGAIESWSVARAEGRRAERPADDDKPSRVMRAFPVTIRLIAFARSGKAARELIRALLDQASGPKESIEIEVGESLGDAWNNGRARHPDSAFTRAAAGDQSRGDPGPRSFTVSSLRPPSEGLYRVPATLTISAESEGRAQEIASAAVRHPGDVPGFVEVVVGLADVIREPVIRPRPAEASGADWPPADEEAGGEIRGGEEREPFPSHPVDAFEEIARGNGIALDPERLAEMRAICDEPVDPRPGRPVLPRDPVADLLATARENGVALHPDAEERLRALVAEKGSVPPLGDVLRAIGVPPPEGETISAYADDGEGIVAAATMFSDGNTTTASIKRVVPDETPEAVIGEMVEACRGPVEGDDEPLGEADLRPSAANRLNRAAESARAARDDLAAFGRTDEEREADKARDVLGRIIDGWGNMTTGDLAQLIGEARAVLGRS